MLLTLRANTLTPSCPLQVFHVAYVLIKFANSPRPDLWVLERSTDFGHTYQPWQFFACEFFWSHGTWGVPGMVPPLSHSFKVPGHHALPCARLYVVQDC